MTSLPPAPTIRVSSGSVTSAPGRRTTEKLTDLANSSNNVAAGIGEVLQALASSSSGPSTKPVLVEFGTRTMAIGRARMLSMNGRNAFLYTKSKFGLLNATTAFFLEATFEGDEEKYVEIDLDSWEELVVYMHKLRIIS